MPSADDPKAFRDRIVFDAFDLADESRREAVFALGNGMLSVRGAAPDARAGDHRYPGTYRAGLYNRLISEIDGQSVANESLVKLPDWAVIRFKLEEDEEWFALESAELVDYRHVFRFDDVSAVRVLTFRDARGRRTRVSETRFVSMDQPNTAALRLSIEPLDWSGEVTVCSGIDGDVSNTNVRVFRPYNNRHIVVEHLHDGIPGRLLLQARTEPGRSAIAVVAVSRWSSAPRSRELVAEDRAIRETLVFAIGPEAPLAIEKIAVIEAGSIADDVDPARRALRCAESMPAFSILLNRHRHRWAALWAQAAFEAEDAVLHQAIRFHFLHLLQTISRHSVPLEVGFPARGWQEGYHGQIFWDELFVFPVFNLRFPELARVMLRYRWTRLDAARRLAREGGFAGAMFPWRSASTGGEETPRLELNPRSGRWMKDDTNRQRHIGAAVAHGVWTYYVATDDRTFLRDHGAEMLVEIARFWASIAKRADGTGRYSIAGVVGPDEYHTLDPHSKQPGLVDNAYTNLMAVWTLLRAREALDDLAPDERETLSARLSLSPDEFARWDEISRTMRIAFQADGIISQFDGFDRLKSFDLDTYRREHGHERVDWALEQAGTSVADVQVVKQTDLLMLFYLLPLEEIESLLARLGYPMTREQLRATARYYVERTSHDSSLSRVAMAGALARLDPALSWHFYEETIRPELVPANRSSGSEGVHLGAMAGTIDVLQRCYLGLRIEKDRIALAPAIPAALGSVSMGFDCRFGRFDLQWTGERLVLRADPVNTVPARVAIGGENHDLAPGRAISFGRKAVLA